METYAMHRLDEDREHVLSSDCWCQPISVSYGAELAAIEADESDAEDD